MSIKPLYDFYDGDFSLSEYNGLPLLESAKRIDYNTLPEGIYYYKQEFCVLHDRALDDYVEYYALHPLEGNDDFYHYHGCIISKQPIDFHGLCSLEINYKDIQHVADSISVEDYLSDSFDLDDYIIQGV